MKEPVTFDFLTQPPDKVMRILERRGEWTGESKLRNTGYCAKNGYFTTLRGSYGASGIKIADLEQYAHELLAYAEILKARQRAQIKGA